LVSVIGHRGAPAHAVENTLDAFLAAARLGADGIELDVRRGADGALIVHHDAVLPDGRPVSNLSRGELPTWVPTLAEVLDAVGPGLLVDIEIKNMPNEPDWDPHDLVARAVAALVADRGRQATSLITSFNLAAIDAARSAEPSVPTGWLTLSGYDQLDALATVVERGHAALLPRHESIDAALVEAAHGHGVQVMAWTVDDPARVKELAALGVDAVITNAPDMARAALA
jgi:glycerophosphoryl diester phosphodiesterase